MLNCIHCDRLVIDMDTLEIELPKPDDAMCTRCEADHDDMMDFIDATCEKDGQPTLSSFLLANDLPLRPGSISLSHLLN